MKTTLLNALWTRRRDDTCAGRAVALFARVAPASLALLLMYACAYGFDLSRGGLRPETIPAPAPWRFLIVGYLLTIAIETPVLVVGLPKLLSLRQRLFAGLWLTACTYPVVVLILPGLLAARGAYLLVAETFAPVAECALFWLAFRGRYVMSLKTWLHSFVVIIIANLLSFGVGVLLDRTGWLGQL